MTDRHLAMPKGLGSLVVVAGLLAVFATYWDEAWHTDIGRDSAWAAPHVLLYAAVAVVGFGIAVWGTKVLLATGSLRAAFGHSPLLAAGLGAIGALVAAPIDAGWHEAYGRDAVLWSPPHMLVVLASTALVLGVVTGLPASAGGLRAAAGVLLLANAAAVVFEYEADVPQFSEVLYLPLLLGVGLATVWLVDQVVPLRVPATAVVLGYATLRMGISGGLLILGRSTPDLPIAVLGLAAYDLPFRRTSRLLAAAALTSGLAWAASATSSASPIATDVAVSAAPVVVMGLLLLALRARRGLLLASGLLVAALALSTVGAERAEAHDPGQGEPIAGLQLVATTTAAGEVALSVHAKEDCDDLDEREVVARRAGEAIRRPLVRVGECRFRGELSLPEGGRWFVYAEFFQDGEPAEAWLSVKVGAVDRIEQTRVLYRPSGNAEDLSWAQVIVGSLVYALGLALLAVGVRAVRARRQPV